MDAQQVGSLNLLFSSIKHTSVILVDPTLHEPAEVPVFRLKRGVCSISWYVVAVILVLGI